MGVQYNLFKFEWFIFVFVVSYGTGKKSKSCDLSIVLLSKNHFSQFFELKIKVNWTFSAPCF